MYLVTIFDTQMPELSYARSFRTFKEVELYAGTPLIKCRCLPTDPETWVSSFDNNSAKVVVVKVAFND